MLFVNSEKVYMTSLTNKRILSNLEIYNLTIVKSIENIKRVKPSVY